MVLSDFLSRQKHNDSNPNEIIPISFNIQHILQSNFYNIGKEKVGKYQNIKQGHKLNLVG